jgi:hypothetical protein
MWVLYWLAALVIIFAASPLDFWRFLLVTFGASTCVGVYAAIRLDAHLDAHDEAQP